MQQDKAKERAFWDRRALKKAYAAFLEFEYRSVLNTAVGVDLGGKKALDIGCASGRSCIILKEMGAEVHGIDISPMLIGQAKQMWGERGKGIKLSVGDAENLDYPDGTFDVCFFGGVLHHLPDRTKAISEAFRVLKSGGKIVAIEPNKKDFLERIGWVMAAMRRDLSPNESPINPQELSYQLSLAGFESPMLGIMRSEVPWLAVYAPYFSRWIVTKINKYRAYDKSGTFFMIDAVKP